MKFKNFDIEDVFGFDDTEQAKAYIGKKGYYADHIEKLDDYIENKSHIDTLYTINKSRDIYRFMVGCSYDYCGYYTYFLPLEKVKKTEPTETKVTYRYRPFRTVAEVDELLVKDNVKHYCYVGSDLYLRYKVYPNITKHIEITNLEVDTNTNELRFINGFTPRHLAENYDIKIAGCWLPFGVEVKAE
jgi:hypothetical protein